MKSVNFGIDLGTTNSLIAKFENGQVHVFKNPVGHKESLASVVAFRPDRRLVGDKAREYLLKDPVNVFGGFKRKMGTDERYYVVNLDDNITPVQLSSFVLQELKNFIHTREIPEACIVTIPASFDTMQSNATIKAAELAGFAEVFLLQEPIAASLAYFNQSTANNNGHWFVYDLGGGTFDVALVHIREGEMKIVDHEGNNFLGGVDFDFGIVEHFIVPEIVRLTGIQNFEEELRVTYGKYEKLYQLLLYKAEEAKKELSTQETTEIDLDLDIDGKNIPLLITISRQQFNETIANTIAATIKMLDDILLRNILTYDDIKQTILVGGSTLIPYVREQLNGRTGITVNTDVDPISAVAVGAAYYASGKYYHPPETDPEIEELLNEIIDDEEIPVPEELSVDLTYPKTSKEDEEVLLVRVNGLYENYTYRIIRNDGGFDTGFLNLKSKFTEFLPLLPAVNNTFYFRVFDEDNNELRTAYQEIMITHGKFSINGQPLPKDICIEVDDKENKTTKLEVIFEKNSILPQKKTLYRTISKTIRKGEDESVIINILEGDRYARPVSNLVIGCIEINGKSLTSDLIKGSDIEIGVTLSESRSLSVEGYLVMTQQDYKNVFSNSEKHISVARLKEQFSELESELRSGLHLFRSFENSSWSSDVNSLMDQLVSHKKELSKLKEKDRSDSKYIIADALCRISQEYDKLGGNDRLESLQAEYLDAREFIGNHIRMADHEKEKLAQAFNKILQSEPQLLRSRNASVLERAIKQLNKLGWDIMYNTNSYLIAQFYIIKEYEPAAFSSYNAAKSIIKMAENALQHERFVEFRQHFYSLTHLMKRERTYIENVDFKGTGIG